MEIEQVLKQLEWLDEERRKDKSVITALQERIQALEGSQNALNQRLQLFENEISRLSTLINRINQYDEDLLQQRIETRRLVEEFEKRAQKSQGESEKVVRAEIKALENDLIEFKGQIDKMTELRRDFQASLEEQSRLGRTVNEFRTKMDELLRVNEESLRMYRLAEENRRQDSKRLNDLQGEIAGLRKKADDQRAVQELLSVGLQKLEARFNEMLALDAERREAQQAFMDQQKMQQVERDQIWKEWLERFEAFEKQAAQVEAQLQSMDATHRAVKRNQEAIEALTERVERRIHEITEIQRLAEERFRQEWNTFKIDDQKRWANYTLSQDEQYNEAARLTDKLSDRLAKLEEQLQQIQDMMEQLNEQTEKGMQSLMTYAHEWMTIFNRLKGRNL